MTATETPSAYPSVPGAAGQWDEADSLAQPCLYWPGALLSAFMLQMAAKGQCVNESMMLGSRAYAIEKLALAHTLQDDTLHALATQMLGYFDDEPQHAVATLVAASQHH